MATFRRIRISPATVRGAVAATPPAGPTPETLPFRRWQASRAQPVSARVRLVQAAGAEQAVEALLSFLPRDLPEEAVPTAQALLAHRDARARTTALLALAAVPDALSEAHIGSALQDPVANVRQAAVCALDQRPASWDRLSSHLEERFADASFDVRQSAFRLAARIAQPGFVGPLIAGLEEDAQENRVASFSARRGALQAITGHEVPLDPPWQAGQCPYAARTRRSRLHVATGWQAWLAHQGGSAAPGNGSGHEPS